MWLLSVVAISLYFVHSTRLEPTDLTDPDEATKALYTRLFQLDEGYVETDKDPADGQTDQVAGLSGGSTAPSHGTPQPSSKTPDKIRDDESIAHSAGVANAGYLSVSGGSGKGQQHLGPGGLYNSTVEVKSDQLLPFYCHPSNPCPKGYTSVNGCEESFVNTADEQRARTKKMMIEGVCPCDQAHMFNCPRGPTVASTVPHFVQRTLKELYEILNSTIQEQTIKNSTNQSVGH